MRIFLILDWLQGIQVMLTFEIRKLFSSTNLDKKSFLAQIHEIKS